MDRLRLACFALFTAALFSGCGRRAQGPPPPPTFAVTGEVRFGDDRPVAKGLVQFIAENGPPRNISAPIKEGKFTLVTSFGNLTLPGATEGRFRVTVISGFDSHGAPIETKLGELYEIKPQDNHFVITLPKTLPKP